MRLILLFLLLCVSVQIGYAQQVSPRMVFMDVVKADSVSKEELYQNARNWLQENQFEVIADSVLPESHKILATQTFPVYGTGYVSKKLSGKITLQVQIEVKEQKYRYQFTHFVFHYYKENRNYQYEPTGKTKPLEDTKASGWQKTWQAHKRTTQTTVANWVGSMKKQLIVRKVVAQKTLVPTEKW